MVYNFSYESAFLYLCPSDLVLLTNRSVVARWHSINVNGLSGHCKACFNNQLANIRIDA